MACSTTLSRLSSRMVKRCFKCMADKPIDQFYRHKMMADGHLSKCKECTKNDVRQNRFDNIERAREYDRTRSTLPHRKALAKSVAERWKSRHPDRRVAEHAACNAVRDGRLSVDTTACQGCGRRNVRVEKHHPDYRYPLVVVALCKPCHAVADVIRRTIEREVASGHHLL